jgi:hypothetical protein
MERMGGVSPLRCGACLEQVEKTRNTAPDRAVASGGCVGTQAGNAVDGPAGLDNNLLGAATEGVANSGDRPNVDGS